MYVDFNLKLSEDQMRQLKEVVAEELSKSFTDAILTKAVKDVYAGHIRSLINEELQTKNYRARVSDKVHKILLEMTGDRQ